MKLERHSSISETQLLSLKGLLIIILSLALFNAKKSFATDELELPIYVFEVKPLIYLDEDKVIKGTWYDSFEELAKISGLKFKYQFTSIPRLELYLGSNLPGCNLTFLKTKKRMRIKNIKFIHDHPTKTIFKAYQRSDDIRVFSLKDFQQNPKISIVSNTSVATDALKELGIRSDLQFSINAITNMLLLKRMDIYVGSNLAVEKLQEFKDKKIKAGIIIKTFTHGIGCSGGTNPEALKKLKRGSESWVLPE